MSIFRRKRSTGRPKAGQLLEFALLLPMALVLLTFAVDMGRLVLASTTLQAAAATGARAGARVGYAGSITAPGDCSGSTGYDNPAYTAFCDAFSITAGAKLSNVELLAPTGGGDAFCITGSDSTEYVTMKAYATIDFITPGLATLVGLQTGGGADFEAVGSARCEVTR
jgi:hypothetical protein